MRFGSGYWRLMGTALVSDLGGRIYQIVALWFIVASTNSPRFAAVYMVASQLPAFLAAPVTGRLIDRTGRRKILLGIAAGASSVSLVVVAGVAAFGHLSLPTVLAVAVIMSIANGITLPCINALIPALVEGHQLERANAVRALSYRAGQLLGPVLAAPVAIVGYAGIFAAAAIAHAAAAFLGAGAKPPHRGITDRTVDPVGDRPRRGSLGRPARHLLTMEASFALAISPMALVIPLYAKDQLAGSQATYSLLLTMIGIGGGAAALAMIKVKIKASGASMATALLTATAGAALATIGTSVALACIGLVVFGVGIVVWGVLARSFEHRAVDSHVTGRFFAYLQGVGGIATPIGFALAGLALEAVTPETMLRVVSAAMAITALLALNAARIAPTAPPTEQPHPSADSDQEPADVSHTN